MCFPLSSGLWLSQLNARAFSSMRQPVLMTPSLISASMLASLAQRRLLSGVLAPSFLDDDRAHLLTTGYDRVMGTNLRHMIGRELDAR